MTGESIFTISLDFELHWGTRDHRSLASYGQNILGGRAAIPRILDLFEEFGIHATWATVGFLFFGDEKELSAAIPTKRPSYMNKALDPYPHIDLIGSAEYLREYYFAPELIKCIAQVPHQEIATHTFCHYYCLEDGQTREEFGADLEAAVRTAEKKMGTPVRSLVFPRNQYNADYLSICRSLGLTAYRGNQRSRLYAAGNQSGDTHLRRAARFLDRYINLTGHHGYEVQRSELTDVPASRFLSPYSRRLRLLEPLRLKRIQTDLTHCAERGLLYHLWWHPRNFGTRTDENLAFLRRLLEHYTELRESHGMRSLTMAEAARATG